jgi:hypothetical protein
MTLAYCPRGRSEVEMHLLPDNSCLLFDPTTDEAHVLNVVGALVWDYCDGTLSRDEIATEVSSLTPQFPGVHQEVLDLLEEFERRGLLQATSD